MFYSLTDLIVIIFKTVEVLIILRILLSWITFPDTMGFRAFIRDFTEPVLKPFRVALQIAPGMGIDLSPVIALFILYQLEMLVLHLIRF